jgi:hypothetical protein
VNILCRGYRNETKASLATLSQLMESIISGRIGRPELEISEVVGEEEYHLGALFVEGSGQVAGWLLSRQKGKRSKIDVFCDEASGDGILNVIFCGCPEAIKNRAILTSENVLSILSCLIDGTKLTQFEVTNIFEVIIR